MTIAHFRMASLILLWLEERRSACGRPSGRFRARSVPLARCFVAIGRLAHDFVAPRQQQRRDTSRNRAWSSTRTVLMRSVCLQKAVVRVRTAWCGAASPSAHRVKRQPSWAGSTRHPPPVRVSSTTAPSPGRLRQAMRPPTDSARSQHCPPVRKCGTAPGRPTAARPRSPRRHPRLVRRTHRRRWQRAGAHDGRGRACGRWSEPHGRAEGLGLGCGRQLDPARVGGRAELDRELRRLPHTPPAYSSSAATTPRSPARESRGSGLPSRTSTYTERAAAASWPSCLARLGDAPVVEHLVDGLGFRVDVAEYLGQAIVHLAGDPLTFALDRQDLSARSVAGMPRARGRPASPARTGYLPPRRRTDADCGCDRQAEYSDPLIAVAHRCRQPYLVAGPEVALEIAFLTRHDTGASGSSPIRMSGLRWSPAIRSSPAGPSIASSAASAFRRERAWSTIAAIVCSESA